MLRLNRISGDLAANLDRRSVRTVKDVKEALQGAAGFQDDSVLKLLEEGTPLDDEDKVNNIPLSVELTVVARTLSEQEKMVKAQMPSIQALCRELPAHLTTAFGNDPANFVSDFLDFLLKMPAKRLQAARRVHLLGWTVDLNTSMCNISLEIRLSMTWPCGLRFFSRTWTQPRRCLQTSPLSSCQHCWRILRTSWPSCCPRSFGVSALYRRVLRLGT